MYGREWFQRLWVVQEIALARECVFLCGTRKVEWDVLVNFAVAMKESVFLANIAALHGREVGEELVGRGTNGIRLMTNVWKMHELVADPDRKEDAVFNTMAVMQSQVASVKVDYVYAVRGMLPDALRERVDVDYSDEAKQNYGMVHARFFRQCLELVRDWPSAYFPPKPAVSGVPSWCPPWGPGWKPGALPQVGCTAGRPSVTSYLPSFNKLGLDFMAGNEGEGVLRVAGVTVDTIRDMCRLDQAIDEKTKILDAEAAIQVIKRCEAYIPAGADGPERLLGILIGECGWADTKYVSGRPDGPLMDSLFAFLQLRAREGGNGDTVEHVGGPFRFWRSYIDLVLNRWPGRALALTTSGRLALVPSHTKLGDTVCLFLGASLPQVVSRHENGEHWTYTGPTVVDGLMKGEFFEITKDWASKKETFFLR
jgi:hypothetical protein